MNHFDPIRSPAPFPASRTALNRVMAVALAVALAAAALACGSRNGAERKPAFRQVTPAVAFEMLRDYSGLPILDVRPRNDFHGPLGHLRNAVSAPASDLPHLLRELAWMRSETFLVYCRAHECEPEVLDFFYSNGFKDAMLIHGGIEAWIDDGFGTVGAGNPQHEDEVSSVSEPKRVEEEDSDDIF